MEHHNALSNCNHKGLNGQIQYKAWLYQLIITTKFEGQCLIISPATKSRGPGLVLHILRFKNQFRSIYYVHDFSELDAVLLFVKDFVKPEQGAVDLPEHLPIGVQHQRLVENVAFCGAIRKIHNLHVQSLMKGDKLISYLL